MIHQEAKDREARLLIPFLLPHILAHTANAKY